MRAGADGLHHVLATSPPRPLPLTMAPSYASWQGTAAPCMLTLQYVQAHSAAPARQNSCSLPAGTLQKLPSCRTTF